MGDSSTSFTEASVLAEASAIDGLTDFGDPSFREPLRVLLDSLAQAPLNALGSGLLRGSVVRSLANRLRLSHWFEIHPEIRDEVIEAPFVVVGMMRSGTTLVQRLLAADSRWYFTLGWESLEPAPRLDWDPGATDPRVAAGETRDANTRRFAPEFFSIHPTYANQAEEEIMFLADAFLSHVPEASCDLPQYRTWLNEQDFSSAYRHLHRTLQLLQWQKKRRGQKSTRWVLKTPAHLGYLETLLSYFPDARIIHMHRDPHQTIPSGASLNTTLWRMHADEVDPRQVGRQWIERMSWTNRRAMEARDRISNAKDIFIDIEYRDAVAAPLATMERIYRAVDIELTADARARMQAWLDADRGEKLPPHRYTGEDFGLSAGEIDREFRDYVARFLTRS